MAEGARLGAAVMFVRDLGTSVGFYQDVLALKVIDRSPTAALLGSDTGTHLILRAMGGAAPHTLGTLGVQYVVWSAASEEHLDQYERLLRKRSAFRERRRTENMTALEGRDPDDCVVMITYPGTEQVPLDELPARIYAW
jgi:catechol-2,3-dioxygenase